MNVTAYYCAFPIAERYAEKLTALNGDLLARRGNTGITVDPTSFWPLTQRVSTGFHFPVASAATA
jgi:hypothetical protein